MSDSNRVALSYQVESTFGDGILAAASEEIRYTSESLTSDTSSTNSQEIRSDRQVTDVIRTNVTAGGDINAELSYGAHDAFKEAVLGGTWSADLGLSIVNTLTATAGAGATFADSGSGLGSIQVGQWVKVSGYITTELPNNGWWRVTAASAASITVEDPDGDIVTKASGSDTVAITGATLVNGVVERSFAFDKNFSDITEFINYTGMRPGTYSMNVAPDSVITETYGFSGQLEDAAGATLSTSTNAATTNDIMNAVDDVYVIRENGDNSTLCFSEISFSVENSLRDITCIGTLGPSDIGIGSFGVTGNLNAYFESRALFEKYLDWTTSSLAFRTEDSDGNAYVVTFPAVKYTSGEVTAGGLDQDVMVNLSWTAFMDSVTGVTMRIDRAVA